MRRRGASARDCAAQRGSNGAGGGGHWSGHDGGGDGARVRAVFHAVGTRPAGDGAGSVDRRGERSRTWPAWVGWKLGKRSRQPVHDRAAGGEWGGEGVSGAWTVPGSRLDVLVVEDEPRLRELLTEVIPEMGLGVRAARSGEEALRMVKQQPPAMAVLDLHLPGMGGIELLEKLRADGWGGPVIILTAFGTLAAARKAIGLEVSDFLEKPCRLRELELALDRARRRIQVVPDVVAEQPDREDEVSRD